MNSSLHRKYQGELLILVAAMIWGFAFYFQKTAMLSIGPLLFVGVRAAIAAIALAPLASKSDANGIQTLAMSSPSPALADWSFSALHPCNKSD